MFTSGRVWPRTLHGTPPGQLVLGLLLGALPMLAEPAVVQMHPEVVWISSFPPLFYRKCSMCGNFIV